MNEVDRLACAPWQELAVYGVTEDNADLLRPGPEMAEKCARRMRQLRAERLLHAVGAMTAEEFSGALREAFSMLSGDDNG